MVEGVDDADANGSGDGRFDGRLSDLGGMNGAWMLQSIYRGGHEDRKKKESSLSRKLANDDNIYTTRFFVLYIQMCACLIYSRNIDLEIACVIFSLRVTSD